MASASTAESGAAGETGRVFRRLDGHQRIQHLLMLTSFITLMGTGWPLRMAGVGGSRAIVDFFGGLEACAMVHRIAAVVMMISVVHHFGYIIWKWRQRALSFAIVPNLQDARDLFDNIRYYLGLRPRPPKYGRWSYFEKFDYWAVFWGILIMFGSGIVLWFPVFFASFLPVWVLAVAHVAHSDEALLAGLAIFIWHFYNVHLRRAVFPMNWVWLTGELTEEQMKHEHALEYEQIMAREAAEQGDAEAEPESESGQASGASVGDEGSDDGEP